MSKKTLDQAAGKFFIGNNSFDENLLLENQVRVKKEQEELQKANEILVDAAKQKQEEINSKLETLEMLPNGNRIIILPYPRNPYRQIMKGSIIVDYDGSFKNPDSGEWDKEKELVACGKVIEVGPDCKILKVDDDIYYDSRTTYPVPFMSLGYQILPEPNVLCVINEGLKQRFNMS